MVEPNPFAPPKAQVVDANAEVAPKPSWQTRLGAVGLAIQGLEGAWKTFRAHLAWVHATAGADIEVPNPHETPALRAGFLVFNAALVVLFCYFAVRSVRHPRAAVFATALGFATLDAIFGMHARVGWWLLPRSLVLWCLLVGWDGTTHARDGAHAGG